MPRDRPRLRPLLARPGARFACAGDNLCCTDAHALGPLTRSEVRSLRVLDPRVVVPNEELDAPVIRTVEGGGCAFLRDGRCEIHARDGADAKPAGCRRFPYRLVGTPEGGRVSTAMRCPCRTLGARPPLDLALAERSLLDNAGRLEAEDRTPARMPLTHRHRVSFGRYRALEQALLERLARGDDPADVLGIEPMPRLREASWLDAAHHFRGRIDGTACGDALAWFGDLLLAMLGEPRAPRLRRWAASFDRAEARAPVAGRADEVLADWVAEEIWSLAWLAHGSFERARADLATRLDAARRMTAMLVRDGVREDRAAAEAVLVAELAGEATVLASVLRSMEPAAEPGRRARRLGNRSRPRRVDGLAPRP